MLVTAPALLLGAVATAGEQTCVPKWDARGVGPLPWQGIACLDATQDAGFVVVGTISPPGDPNVLLLDSSGKLIGQYRAGHRWIGAVAVSDDGQRVAAVCTSVTGQAGDKPMLYVFAADQQAPQTALGKPVDSPGVLFHYGDHSNHLGIFLDSVGDRFVLTTRDQVSLLDAESGSVKQRHAPKADGGKGIVASALSVGGRIVVGAAADPSGAEVVPRNVFVFEPGNRKPLWERTLNSQTDAISPPEKPLYGTPLLADGSAPERPHEDTQLWAALSVAISVASEQDELARLMEDDRRLVAVADYQGYERWVISSATRRKQRTAVRLVPSRPTITVYDEEGQVVRRFGAEQFDHPLWCDLAFTGDGGKLLAYPHNWACRGLAGQPILPADDEARDLYVLDIQSGRIQKIEFPDAISDMAVSQEGTTVVGCWDGRVYILDDEHLSQGTLPPGVEVGGPSLLEIAADGSRIVVAMTGGVVSMLDANGRQLWQNDLNTNVQPGEKAWLKKQKAAQIAPGVWRVGGGRTHSDMGGQFVIQAPDGLLLVDPNAGLSFDANWASIKGAGLDPERVRYVLITHEHGDHSPGAYLWRVAAGAEVAASRETAYVLRHLIPGGTGYGFHPPNPADIPVSGEAELELAGLKVRAMRLSGHTYGSMGWSFEKDGQTYVAWGEPLLSAAYGDVDGDGQPGVAVLTQTPEGCDVKIYCNQGGSFGERPGCQVNVPEIGGGRIRLAHVNDDGVADLLAATEGAASLVISQNGRLDYRVEPLPRITRPVQLLCDDFDGDGRNDCLFGQRFAGGFAIASQSDEGRFLSARNHPVKAGYFDTQLADLNADGQKDVVTSGGEAFLRQPNGRLPESPLVQLTRPTEGWTFMGTGDFNGDQRIDVALVAGDENSTTISAFYNTDDPRQPLRPDPNTSFDITAQRGPLRDGPTVGDYDGDRVADLLVCSGQTMQTTVLLGSRDGGLDPKRKVVIPLDYSIHFDTKLGLADFNGDGKADVAGWGTSAVKVQGVYIWLQSADGSVPPQP